MSDATQISAPSDRELLLTRWIDASPETVYRCWTEPDLLRRWFAPAPFEMPVAELEVRAGGGSRIVMRSPAGDEIECPGVYLEVVPGKRLVMTDAYTRPWEPSAKPFMTMIVSFEPEGEGTRYSAHVRHWSTADREKHEEMGFHTGWRQCAEQLATLAQSL